MSDSSLRDDRDAYLAERLRDIAESIVDTTTIEGKTLLRAAERLTALYTTVRAVHDNAAAHHAGEDGKARALYVIANWTAEALSGGIHRSVEMVTEALDAEPEYAEVEFDPADYDTIEKVAETAAPLFATHGWAYADGVPTAARLAETIGRYYESHREKPLHYTGSGRIMLYDENPHDGQPVLYDGIQVYLHVGELPPVRGDEVTS